MEDLGYDPNDTHDTGDDPIAFGNRVAHTDHRQDGRTTARTRRTTTPIRARFDVGRTRRSSTTSPGTTLKQPDRWQPINLSVAATQNGIILPGGRAGRTSARSGAT